jgi:hypothetical protein
VFGAVKALYEQMEGMGPLLQDPKKSSIRIVLNPEKMVISESQRLYTYLNLFGFPVDAVIANRVLPKEASSGYLDHWLAIQAGYLAEARQSFEPLPFFEARFFDREMVGLPLLQEFAEEVFGDRDPTEVFYCERPLEVKREGAGYAMYIRYLSPRRTRSRCGPREAGIQVDNQTCRVAPRYLAEAVGGGIPGAASGSHRQEDHARYPDPRRPVA